MSLYIVRLFRGFNNNKQKKHYSRNYTAIINNGFFQLQSENQSRWGKRKNRNNSQA